MSQQLVLFTQIEARVLTDEVKRDAAALWAKLLRLYEGGAHLALGYASWANYCAAEFDMGQSRSYQVLDAARVVESLNDSTIVERPRSEGVARELVPILRESPQQVQEVWAEVVDEHGPTPTAAQVREHVEPRRSLVVHFSSETDEWATPQEFFDACDAEFGFQLDVCALETSAKCDRYFTPDNDGLAQTWTGRVWMNPPYGNVIGDWIAKAWESADAGDAELVACLVPARVDTAWWWDYCRWAEIRFLRGRLKFGGADTSAPFPSALVVFGRPQAVLWWEDWK